MLLLPLPAAEGARLDVLLNDPRFEGAIVSATVMDMDGRIVYGHDSGVHVAPASNMKLLTSAFALDTLGPEYRAATKFWKMPDGLHIESEGDPMMTHQDLLNERKALGEYNDGTVWVKEAYAPQIPPSWELDDLPNKYAAAVTALTIDRGAFELWAKRGRPELEPFAYGVKIVDNPSQSKWHSEYDPFERTVDVSGKLPDKDTMLDTLALPRPDEAAASLLGRRFRRTDSSPTTPPDAILTGHSTFEIIRACLPPSDNNLAENLLMLSASRLSVRPSDPYEIGEREETRFLTTVVGIDPNDLHVVDGSGMSRQDFVTTRAVARLLVWGSKQPTGALWKDAMASPDKGTIKGRLAGVDFHGKTGSLNMVSSLSGYLHTRSGRDLAVSLIFNQFTATTSEAHRIQDAFVRVLDSDTP